MPPSHRLSRHVAWGTAETVSSMPSQMIRLFFKTSRAEQRVTVGQACAAAWGLVLDHPLLEAPEWTHQGWSAPCCPKCLQAGIPPSLCTPTDRPTVCSPPWREGGREGGREELELGGWGVGALGREQATA